MVVPLAIVAIVSLCGPDADAADADAGGLSLPPPSETSPE